MLFVQMGALAALATGNWQLATHWLVLSNAESNNDTQTKRRNFLRPAVSPSHSRSAFWAMSILPT